ncbi:MAG TPA: hypothetical protein PK024_10705 [Methanospirillum sp.]|nr:hypothetical protein [Methanospirillum sp.]HOJ97291.1 hypothetical protein [Methanospirillum sp.]HOL42442.1 hypothetical protein [Methanospirillum sp.]HPP77784.1 hypothetical protein [Methanospirillum sp.]
MDRKIQAVLDRQNPWWFGRPYNTGQNRLGSFLHVFGTPVR